MTEQDGIIEGVGSDVTHVIETPAATPNMMKPIDGGMTGAMMPPAAINPQARGTLYPASRIIGIRIAASAAVSAIAEPDRLAITTADRIATYPSPPCKCPSCRTPSPCSWRPSRRS